MGFFGFLRNSPNLHDDVSSPVYFEEDYTGLAALTNSDVFTAISIVSADVARFPIRILDKQTGIDDEAGGLSSILNSVTDTNMSSYQWKFAMTVNAITTGNSYSRIVRDPVDNTVAQIQFYPPSQVSVDTTDFKNPKYYFTPSDGSKTIEEPASNVIHLRLFSVDTFNGRSPLLSLKNEVKLQNDGIKTLVETFSGGSFKTAILKAKGQLSPKARREIKTSFLQTQEDSKSGEPIVLDDTVEYKPLEINTQLLQLINSNNYSTAQIAKVLRVPSYRLAQNSPNQSVKQLSEDYLKNDLPFYFKAFESELEMKLLTEEQRKNLKIEFDTREITGLSIEDASRLINNGIATPNEVRNKMGGFPIIKGDLDRFQSSLNTVYMDEKEEYQERKRGYSNLKGGDADGKETDPDSD